MKKFLLTIIACIAVLAAQAFPKALYVVKGGQLYKYNFGVAADLNFFDNGTKLRVSGYNEVIELDKVDYISFSAPKVSTLTPSEQKQKMVDIADKFYRKFNIRDYEEAIFMCDHFVRKYNIYSFDADRYFNLHSGSSYSPMHKYMTAVGKLAKGNIGYAPATRAAAELWQASDFYGVFVPDQSSHDWTKASPADYLELRFPAPDGSTYSVKAVPSAQYTDWTEVDFIGRVPRTITVTGSKGDRVLFTTTIENIINDQKKAIETIVKTTVNNLEVRVSNTITDTTITELTTVEVKGETVCTVSANVYGRDFTNYEKWKADFDNMTDEYYDPVTGYWMDGDDFACDVMAPRVFYGKSEVDLIGELQVKGRVSQLKKLVDVLNEDSYIGTQEEWDYNKNECRVWDDDPAVVERQAQYLNTYADVAFYYDHTTALQGYFSWDVDVDDDYSYYSDGYWDYAKDDWVEYGHTRIYVYHEIMPLLTFPDLTTFAVEDFFNETDFNLLVNDYDRLLDD